MGKWNSARKILLAQTERYSSERTAEIRNVHQTLLARALMLLKYINPETEMFFAPMLRTMMQTVIKPDNKGDYENGMGLHYYCASDASGRKYPMRGGYYANGIGDFSRSARTMFEENFTMALAFGYAGFSRQCAENLGRAVHMICDMCCLPHATKMTYYSSKRKIHKAYENFAEVYYPEFLAEQKISSLPDIFSSHSGFEKAINKISGKVSGETSEFLSDPVKEICARLYHTEIVTASLLMRFYSDMQTRAQHGDIVVTGLECRINQTPLSLKVTQKGVEFHGVNPFPSSKLNVVKTSFNLAHRRDGLYTLSPVGDKNGKVIEISHGRLSLSKFSPTNKKQLFKLIHNS